MSAPAPDPKSAFPATVLTALQQFTSPDAFPSTGLHPFSSSPEEMLLTLRRIVDTTNQAAVSLNAHLSLPLSNPKLLSLYRQQASISYAVQQVGLYYLRICAQVFLAHIDFSGSQSLTRTCDM